MNNTKEYYTNIIELFNVLEALFDTETGCPWDRQQTTQSMCKYLIDEVYELVDAIHDSSRKDIVEETGDVFFLLAMLLKVYSTERSLLLEEALTTVVHKMRSRHPHVFGTTKTPETEKEYTLAWEQSKREEKQERASKPILASVPRSAHPFTKAIQIQKKLHSASISQPSLEATLHTLLHATEQKKEQEEALAQHIYSIVAFAKEHSLDIQSILEQYNHKILEDSIHILP